MINKILLSIILSIFILVYGCTNNNSKSQTPKPEKLSADIENQDLNIVSFNDPQLEQAIRTVLEKPTGTISKDSLKNITQLYVEGKAGPSGGILNLDGIEQLQNLKELNISLSKWCSINLDNISSLQNLESLYIEAYSLPAVGIDINEISKFKNLKQLSLNSFSALKDISLLSNLDKLEILSISYASITDISSLKYLTNLRELSLTNINIGYNGNSWIKIDLSSLKDLNKLKKLYLKGSNVKNYRPILTINNDLTDKDFSIPKEDYLPPKKIGTVLGNILSTDILTYFNGNLIPSMNINGRTVIIVEDLKDYGYDVSWEPDYRTLLANEIKSKQINPITLTQENKYKKIGTIVGKVLYSDIVTYLSGSELPSTNINGRTVIVVEDLKDYGFTVQWNPTQRTLTAQTQNIN